VTSVILDTIVDLCSLLATPSLLMVRHLMCADQIDEAYEPASTELRMLFGLQLEQRRNDALVDNKLFTDVVTARKHVGYIMIVLCMLSVKLTL